MKQTFNMCLRGGVLLLAAGLLAGPALAGPDDVNPVFAEMQEIAEAELEQINGRGVVVDMDATVGGTIFDSCLDGCISNTGDNTIDGSAFSGSSVFAAIVQNSGNNVSVQNLLVVVVDMVD